MIGSNLVQGLNALGIDDVIAVDDLTDGPKYRNLLGARLSDYFDRSEFYGRFARAELGRIDAVFHEGACSDTMEHNGRFMLDSNYRCSKDLLDACQAQGTRLLYASSAATYGGSASFREEPEFEQPLNVYGWSKLLFDNIVRRALPDITTQVAGFRYFNVYGPREQHKGRMASVAFHFFHQYRKSGSVRLFAGSGGYAAGEQRRDFVAVSDVVAANLDFLGQSDRSGIYNLGSGRAESFNDVARHVINACRAQAGEPALGLAELVHAGAIEYTEFPPQLAGKYQSFTQADLTALHAAGYRAPMTDVETGVRNYVEWLMASSGASPVT